jgi:hypothetical protein
MKDMYDEYYPDQSLVGSERSHSKHGLFHLNMVFALASVDLYRSGRSHRHPMGYFLAAIRSASDNLRFGSIHDIQGFLLLAGFGQYYSTGRYLRSLRH